MKSTIAVVLVLVFTSVRAYEAEQARNNFAHEAAECAAYFALASSGPNLDPNTADGLRVRSEGLLEQSIMMSSQELTKARLNLAIETMKREMKANWSNFSIVNQKYGYRCLDFSNDPDDRMRYWLEKKE